MHRTKRRKAEDVFGCHQREHLQGVRAAVDKVTIDNQSSRPLHIGTINVVPDTANPPEVTVNANDVAFDGDWFRTGDLGRVRPAGEHGQLLIEILGRWCAGGAAVVATRMRNKAVSRRL